MNSKSMFRAAALVAAGGVALSFAAPAAAARTLCTDGSNPAINLVTTPCVWSPGPPGNDKEADVELAIFEATGVNVDIALYGKSEGLGLLKFKFDPSGAAQNDIGNPGGQMEVDWTVLNGTLIKYVTVKGANEFKVYELAGLGASTGIASSLFLQTPPNKKGKFNQPGISHISFWTAAAPPIPEPSTWAMMILGFGAVGGAMRSARKRRTTLAFG